MSKFLRLTSNSLVAFALVAGCGCQSTRVDRGAEPAPAGTATPRPHGIGVPALLKTLVEVLATGDQEAYERFVQANFSPAALAEQTAEDHAASLARIYTDTGGFTIERPAGEGRDWVQAEARARVTGIRYCLTLERSEADGRSFISGFVVRDLHPAGPELETPAPDEVERTLKRLVDDFAAADLFSGVILVARDDHVVFEGAYGLASRDRQVPITLDTRLNTASIGKLFTGTAIAQLVAAGKLSFDDPVGKVLPDYPSSEVRDRVTVRQLLTHTSGLGPRDYYDHPDYPAQHASIRTVPDLMRFVIDTPLEGKPGEYLYSNAGYIILGAIVERLSGQSFYEYVQRSIFEPAGMTRSLYAPGDLQALGTVAALTNFHEREKGSNSYVYRLGPLLESEPGMGGPFGGAWVTARDLLAFSRALRGGVLVSPAILAEMTTAQGPAGAGASGLTGQARPGLGVEVITRNGHTFFGHTGGDFGIASFLYWYPETGYTSILLSNRDPRAARMVLNASRALITRKTLGGAAPPPQMCTPPTSQG